MQSIVGIALLAVFAALVIYVLIFRRPPKEEGAEDPVLTPSLDSLPLTREEDPSVEPEILAVITAVIEAETLLSPVLEEGRMTFDSQKSQRGWSDTSRLALRPFEGEVRR